jgi:hypothetical protein
MVTLTTIIYDGNFKNILRDDSWFLNFENKYVTKKRLNVNNISNKVEFDQYVNNMRNIGFDFEIVYVDDLIEEANKYFNLNINRNTLGFNYSIPYFTDILSISTPYMFNVTSDCQLDIRVSDDFFEKSIELVEGDNLYPLTVLSEDLPWDNPIKRKEMDSISPIFANCNSVGEWEQLGNLNFTEDKALDNFWCSWKFSDRVWFGKISKLKNINYTLKGNAPWYDENIMPYAGRNAFECMVTEYLASVGIFRPIYKSKTDYYFHRHDSIITEHYNSIDKNKII